jgi:hypothetical protein
MDREFRSFSEFYPHYLGEHRNPTCRRLHFVGTAFLLAILVGAMITRRWWLLALLPVVGYGFAWVGHFAFEHNRPATFRHPWYSLAGDFMMFRDMLAGRVPL